MFRGKYRLSDLSTDSGSGNAMRILKTMVLNVSFVAFGALETAKGPALLDFRDLLRTDLPTISYLFIVRSVGSIVGAFMGSFLLDKFLHARYLLLFIFTLALGMANGLLSYSGSLVVFFALIFVCGWSTGSLDAGGNVLCLDVWRGHGGEHWMHSIHFSFAAGAFLGPVIVKPFLTKTVVAEVGTPPNSNATLAAEAITEEDFGIKTAFLVMGLVTAVVSLSYLAFHLVSLKNPAQHQELQRQTNPGEAEAAGEGKGDEAKVSFKEAEGGCKGGFKFTYISLMITFFFLYVGMEVMYGTFLTTFAVTCNLGLTKQEGATATAIFWGGFAAMRLLTIFISMKLRPIHFLAISFCLCLAGSIALAASGDKSTTVLHVASALLGVGMGPAFASSMLWLEEHLTVSNRIGSAMIIASSAGADVFPIVLGHFIARLPMLLMYLLLGGVMGCLVLFCLSMVVARRLPEKHSYINAQTSD